MSERVKSFWHGDAGAYGPRRERRSCHYEAYVPDRLGDLPLTLSHASAADVADAERALAVFDARARDTHDLDQLARFLLRAEAVASSKIEGLQVNTRRLARQEIRTSVRDQTAEEVLGNVRAMTLAVDGVARASHLDTRHILDIHRELMLHSPAPHAGGIVRTSQNWIGGNDYNPCDAAFVPPPPDHVDVLLADLSGFLNRDDLPAIMQAAVAHAQFETIHPFADGNGRTGRALVHVVLKRRGLATSFVPPISLILATDTDAYVGGLNSFRYDGEPHWAGSQEGVQRWIDLFVAAAARAAQDAGDLCDSMLELESQWRRTLRPRGGSAAARLLPLLIAHPVVRVADVARRLEVSRQAATLAVNRLVDAGILSQVGTGRRDRIFEAPDVFAILTDYERASATRSGDTRDETPGRPVPSRYRP